MDADRVWVVRASLLILAVSFIFFVIARPAFDFPMQFDQTIRVLQIIFPVFVGYLGLCAAYLIAPTDKGVKGAPFQRNNDALARLLLRGPVYLIATCTVALIVAFWLSNIPSARPGTGMSVDNFSWFLSLLMGLLAASSGLIVARLFPGSNGDVNGAPTSGKQDVVAS